MANDHRYYIRAGAHTVSANHFIVEAIHARRGLRTPLLSHIVRLKPGNSGVIQLGIVVLNAAAAINVSLKIDALPQIFTPDLEEKLSLQIPIISEQFPLFFDIYRIKDGRQKLPPFEINLTYSDMTNRTYHQSFEVDIDLQLGPNISSWYNGYGRIEQALKDITEAITNSNSF
jgi:hypothetical protein